MGNLLGYGHHSLRCAATDGVTVFGRARAAPVFLQSLVSTSSAGFALTLGFVIPRIMEGPSRLWSYVAKSQSWNKPQDIFHWHIIILGQIPSLWHGQWAASYGWVHNDHTKPTEKTCNEDSMVAIWFSSIQYQCKDSLIWYQWPKVIKLPHVSVGVASANQHLFRNPNYAI